MFGHKLNLLFGPEDSGSAGDLTLEDTIKLMAEDDEGDEDKETIELPKDKKPEKKEEVKEEKEDEEVKEDDEEDKDEDEDDELDELVEELEEPDDEDLELTTPVPRREILAKYPQLFKEFPYLEKAYYREQQFTQIFPSLDDAKEAQAKSGTLDSLEKELADGNIKNVLSAVKEVNKTAFNKLADDYLTTLREIDSDAWNHVAGNFIKDTIVAMVGEANRSQNDSLKAAAALLNQFEFGTTEFEAAKKLYKETEKDNSAEEKLKKERQEFVQQRYETARNDISSRVDNLIKRTIADNIDPKSSMTDYVRKQASREAFEQIQDLINKDARFKSILDKLWKYSFNSNFSRDSQDKIRRAFITRAKTVLPSAIKKARNEALKGLGKRVKEETDELPEEKEESVSNKPKKLGQSTTPKFSGKTDRDKAKQIPRGMSALDYLMQD
jgi:hypothetical protein